MKYEPYRSILFFISVMLIILVLPNYIGITAIKPEYIVFRQILDTSVFVVWCVTLLYSIIAIIYNAYRRPTDEK